MGNEKKTSRACLLCVIVSSNKNERKADYKRRGKKNILEAGKSFLLSNSSRFGETTRSSGSLSVDRSDHVRVGKTIQGQEKIVTASLIPKIIEECGRGLDNL